MDIYGVESTSSVITGIYIFDDCNTASPRISGKCVAKRMYKDVVRCAMKKQEYYDAYK